MAPDDEEEGGGGGPVIIDPRSVNRDHMRADRLCSAIAGALKITDETGGRDGYADIAAQRLEEALMWAKKHRESFE
jgi:hypothetical protein